MQRAKKDVVVMHPGPINRGVEITPEVADGSHSVVLQQVSAGVAVRMAVLFLTAGVKEAQSRSTEGPALSSEAHRRPVEKANGHE